MSEGRKNKNKPAPVRILFVEDDRSIRELIQLVFKKTDYELDIAENGAIAMEMYNKNDYSLILMDLKMPVMDGIQATKEIRVIEKKSGRRKTPIIALTAHGTNNDIKESEQAGCDAHLVKPVKKQDLLSEVEKYLKG